MIPTNETKYVCISHTKRLVVVLPRTAANTATMNRYNNNNGYSNGSYNSNRSSYNSNGSNGSNNSGGSAARNNAMISDAKDAYTRTFGKGAVGPFNFIGNQPITVMKKDVKGIKAKDWSYLLKFDGSRAIVFVSNGRLFTVDRKNNFGVLKKALPSNVVGNRLAGVEMTLDCEVMYSASGGGIRLIKAFDLLSYNSEDTRKDTFLQRMADLDSVVKKHFAGVDWITASKPRPLKSLGSHVSSNGGGIMAMNNNSGSPIDGIVLMQNSAPYKRGSHATCLKYKNPDEQTIDLRVDMDAEVDPLFDELYPVDLMCYDGAKKREVLFAKTLLTRAEVNKYGVMMRMGSPRTIYELAFVPEFELTPVGSATQPTKMPAWPKSGYALTPGGSNNNNNNRRNIPSIITANLTGSKVGSNTVTLTDAAGSTFSYKAAGTKLAVGKVMQFALLPKRFKPKNHRDDKEQPNALNTARSVWGAIKDPVSPEELMGKKVASKNKNKSPGGGVVVAKPHKKASPNKKKSRRRNLEGQH